MLKTTLIALLVGVLALQFTGGVRRIERAWPNAVCFGLVPDFSADGEPCAGSDGVLVHLQSSPQPRVVQVPRPEMVPPVPTDDTITVSFEPRNAFKPEMGVVFSPDRVPLLTQQCSRVVPGQVEGTWVPSADQIGRLEIALTGFLDITFRRAYEREYVPENYYRQYGGVVVWGRHLIYVNGFHRSYVDRQFELPRFPDARARDWRRDPAMVCDGGRHYFGALFDPEANFLIDVEFNGVG